MLKWNVLLRFSLSIITSLQNISSDILGFTGDEATRNNLKLLIKSLSRLLWSSSREKTNLYNLRPHHWSHKWFPGSIIIKRLSEVSHFVSFMFLFWKELWLLAVQFKACRFSCYYIEKLLILELQFSFILEFSWFFFFFGNPF